MRNIAGHLHGLQGPSIHLHQLCVLVDSGTQELYQLAHDPLTSLGFKPWEEQKDEGMEESEAGAVIALDPSPHPPSRLIRPPTPLPGLPTTSTSTRLHLLFCCHCSFLNLSSPNCVPQIFLNVEPALECGPPILKENRLPLSAAIKC